MATTFEVLGEGAQRDPEGEQRLAFFLPQVVELTPDDLRREAVVYAGKINPDVDPDFKAAFTKILNMALSDLDESIGQGGRDLLLKVSTELRMFSRMGPVLKDFGLESGEEGMDMARIPAAHITGHRSLPFPQLADMYRPVLDMRIATSSDPSQQVYVGAGKTETKPSLGTWHRFPLDKLEIVSVL